MTKITTYGFIHTNDIITNYYHDDKDNLIIVFRNGDDYENVKIHSYYGSEFINTIIDLPNYHSEIDNIVNSVNILSLDRIKELLKKYKGKLPDTLIKYDYLDENLALTLFFEYLLEELIQNKSTFVYINRH